MKMIVNTERKKDSLYLKNKKHTSTSKKSPQRKQGNKTWIIKEKAIKTHRNKEKGNQICDLIFKTAPHAVLTNTKTHTKILTPLSTEVLTSKDNVPVSPLTMAVLS